MKKRLKKGQTDKKSQRTAAGSCSAQKQPQKKRSARSLLKTSPELLPGDRCAARKTTATLSEDQSAVLKNAGILPEDPPAAPNNPGDLPGDLRAVLNLSQALSELDRRDAYVARSDYRRVIAAAQKDLRDLQVLREKKLLDFYCRQHGMTSSLEIEKVISLCTDDTVSVETASQNTVTRETAPGESSSAPLQRMMDAHNAGFLAQTLITEKDYLDHILDPVDPQIRLDEAQRRMVLTDEDNCLVIAGAGAGKTTSVAAKVKYLVDRKNIRPEEILVISFTNKAVDELRTRIQKDLKIPCPICTFHSAGNAVLHMHDPERINIVDADKKFYVIRDYFRGNILRDERLVHSLILFFASYFDAPLNETDLEAFFRGIAQMRYTSMKSELGEYCAEIMDAQLKKKVTIRNEIMRSAQEVEIANFLYRNGIDYIYEPVYRYHIEMAKKPYTPDFLIRQGDREIYLEHFGITQDGKNSRYDPHRLQAYKDAVNNKVLLHRRHGTELIYTFSGYRDGRPLTEHLEGELRAHGIEFHPRSEEEILKKILQNAENRYVRKLILLICRFITNFKTDGYTEMQFAVMKESTDNVRTKLFLDICQACYLEYQRTLRELRAVDFEDMINDSARALRECAELQQRLPFKYIIVDEYQDISRQRFDLTRALREVCDAKVIAVGDDWQSIYAFSGSDITLFTEFEKKMGPASMLRIENTYRNAQELIDIAGSFVQKNPTQITKTLHSEKRIEDPVIIYSYDASRKGFGKAGNAGANYNMGRAIETALDHIVLKHGLAPQTQKSAGSTESRTNTAADPVSTPDGPPQDGNVQQLQQASRDQPRQLRQTRMPQKPPKIRILMLGRYNFDGYKLEQTDLFTYRGKGAGRQIISKKYPFLQITFMTAHASKGLGYDEVIVINGQGGTYGFPSRIEDDPVLSLVLREDRSYAYAEERRLFYVAMTRTKNRVYFIAPIQEPSEFLQELLRDYKNVRLDPAAETEHCRTEKEKAGGRESAETVSSAGEKAEAVSSAGEKAETVFSAGEKAEAGIASIKAADSKTDKKENDSGDPGKKEKTDPLAQKEAQEKERFLQQSATGLDAGRKICPICGYPLQLRYKAAYGLRLYLCTNDSEICGFMTNNLRGGPMSIIKCDRCIDGYLIVHTPGNGGRPFLGCTNYTRDKKGCGRTMGWPEYQQKMRYEAGYKNRSAE